MTRKIITSPFAFLEAWATFWRNPSADSATGAHMTMLESHLLAIVLEFLILQSRMLFRLVSLLYYSRTVLIPVQEVRALCAEDG